MYQANVTLEESIALATKNVASKIVETDAGVSLYGHHLYKGQDGLWYAPPKAVAAVASAVNGRVIGGTMRGGALHIIREALKNKGL